MTAKNFRAFLLLSGALVVAGCGTNGGTKPEPGDGGSTAHSVEPGACAGRQTRCEAPTMAAQMLTGMLLMALAFWMYSIAVTLVRVRCIIRERESEAPWLAEAVA